MLVSMLFRFRHVIALAILLILTSVLALGEEPMEEDATLPRQVVPNDTPPPSGEGLRVSALIQFAGGLKVGFVDAESKDTFFLGVGERKQGVELIEANFETENVVVEKNGVRWTLQLETDPNAPILPVAPPPVAGSVVPDDGTYRGEGIETFLREHPEAIIKGRFPGIQPPPPGTPPVEGFGPGIEKFLRENPELAEKASRPAVGRGETIEKLLKDNPELAEQVNRPVEGRGEGIEKFLRENPELLSQGAENGIPGGIPAGAPPGTTTDTPYPSP